MKKPLKKNKLTWKAVKGADCYQIYRFTLKNGTYSHMKTVTGRSYVDTAAKAGKTYYYKVVAVHSKTDANSAKTEAVSIKAK